MIKFLQFANMELVKLLAQKLKNQSISEVAPANESGIMSNDLNEVDECEPGTESDEENAEICSITEGLQTHNQENKPVSVKSPPLLSGVPPRVSASPSHATTAHAVRRPFRQVHPYNQRADSHTYLPPVATTAALVDFTMSLNSSMAGSSAANNNDNQHQNNNNKHCYSHCTDLDRYVLDTDHSPVPASGAEAEGHSSEEELAVINLMTARQALTPVAPREKRKWSQVISVESASAQRSKSNKSLTSHCSSGDGSQGSNANSPASADEEVKDVLYHSKPSNFSSSPPRGVQRLRRTISPRLFMANVSPANNNNVNSQTCWISPRKRQRQSSLGDSEATVMQRPCLDLEKMQKLSSSRKHHCYHHHHHHNHHHHGVSSRARVVKIKTFNGSGRPAKCILDPAVFSFRSISTSYNQLTPVEEPCAF